MAYPSVSSKMAMAPIITGKYWEIQLQMVDLHCHVSLPDIW